MHQQNRPDEPVTAQPGFETKRDSLPQSWRGRLPERRSGLYRVIPIPVPGSDRGEHLAGEVLSQDLTDGGYPRGVIQAGHDHAVRADGCHCPRR